MSKLGPITLYYNPFSRAGRPRWMLEELGLSYELKHIDMSKGEHKTPEHLKVHPLGLVPAMKIGDKAMIESSAMCLWLADQCPEKKMTPALDSPQRADYYQWILFCQNHLEPELMKVFLHTKRLPEGERSSSEAQRGRDGAKKAMDIMASALGKHHYMAGEAFSAADVVVGSALIWAASMDLMEGNTTLRRYVDSLKGRPGYQRSLQKS